MRRCRHPSSSNTLRGDTLASGRNIRGLRTCGSPIPRVISTSAISDWCFAPISGSGRFSPVSQNFLVLLAAQGTLDEDSVILWRTGMDAWQPFTSIQALGEAENPGAVACPLRGACACS